MSTNPNSQLGWLSGFVPQSVIDHFKQVSLWTVIKMLPFDGGPSETRWVYIRTSEVISFGWLALVISAIRVYLKTGRIDSIWAGLIITLGGGLFTFAQRAQVTKLSLDSAAPGTTTQINSTPLNSTVTTGVPDDAAK